MKRKSKLIKHLIVFISVYYCAFLTFFGTDKRKAPVVASVDEGFERYNATLVVFTSGYDACKSGCFQDTAASASLRNLKTLPARVVHLTPCSSTCSPLRKSSRVVVLKDVVSSGHVVLSGVLALLEERDVVDGLTVLVPDTMFFGDRLFVTLQRLRGDWMAFSRVKTIKNEFDPKWIHHVRRGATEQVMEKYVTQTQRAGMVVAWKSRLAVQKPYAPFIMSSTSNALNDMWQKWSLLDGGEGTSLKQTVDVTLVAPCYQRERVHKSDPETFIENHNRAVLDHPLFWRENTLDIDVVGADGVLEHQSQVEWFRHIEDTQTQAQTPDVQPDVVRGQTYTIAQCDDAFQDLANFACNTRNVMDHKNTIIITHKQEFALDGRMMGFNVYYTKRTLDAFVDFFLEKSANVIVVRDCKHLKLRSSIANDLSSSFGNVFVHHFAYYVQSVPWTRQLYASGRTFEDLCDPYKTDMGRCAWGPERRLVSKFPPGAETKMRFVQYRKKNLWNADLSSCTR